MKEQIRTEDVELCDLDLKYKKPKENFEGISEKKNH